MNDTGQGATRQMPVLGKLITACEEGEVETVREILQSSLDAKNTEEVNAGLVRAASMNHTDVVLLLMSHGAKSKVASVNAVEVPNGKTALDCAVENGRAEVVHLLLKLGTNPRIENAMGRTLLLDAASRGLTEIVGHLLDFGADIEDGGHTSTNQTPLAAACEKGFDKTAALLLARGANVDGAGKSLTSPLYYAAKSNNVELLTRLLRLGADRKLALGQQRKGSRVYEEHSERTSADASTFSEEIHRLLKVSMALEGPEVRKKTGQKLSDRQVTSFISPPDSKDDYRNHCCNGLKISITEFHNADETREMRQRVEASVYEVLYGSGPKALLQAGRGNPELGGKPNFTWYHIPANNLTWVEHLITRIRAECTLPGPEWSNGRLLLRKMDDESRRNFQLVCRKPSRGLSNTTKVRKSLYKELKVPQGDANHEGILPEEVITTLVLPYLHLETEESFKEMTKALEILEQKSAKEQDISDEPSPTLSRDLLWGYLGSGTIAKGGVDEGGLQPRRTLDQYRYAHVGRIKKRNADQVVLRYTSSKDYEKAIFMVDQLWMWILDEDTLITCIPTQWDSEAVARETDHPQDSIIDKRLGDCRDIHKAIENYLTRRHRDPVGSVHDLAELVMTRCVSVFFQQHMPEHYDFFDFFEKSLTDLLDNVAECLKALKTDVNAGKLSSMTKALDCIIEVEDILDELDMLHSVLKEQQEILEGYRGKPAANSTDPAYIVPTKSLLNCVRSLERQAEKARVTLYHITDLKQKHNSHMEAISASESAASTARQGSSILLFTIITVVFAPISFIAAFFAIPTDGLSTQSDGKIPFDYVVKCVVSVGVALSAPFIILAFNLDRASRAVKYLKARTIETYIYLSLVVAVTIVLVMIWTSHGAVTMKAAVTIAMIAVLASGVTVWRLCNFLSKRES